MRITAHNRGPQAAPIHLLPTIWFRNTWSWLKDAAKPIATKLEGNRTCGTIGLEHPDCGMLWLYYQEPADKLRQILRYVLDETEFLSQHGIRALSRFHRDNPYVMKVHGMEHRVDKQPGESKSELFGGNSNWRGPIWFPMNFLLIESLQKFHRYYGDEFKVEFPTGSRQMFTLAEVAAEISRRLNHIFLRGKDARRPVAGNLDTFQNDPHWNDLILFHEYFHGDTGVGVGRIIRRDGRRWSQSCWRRVVNLALTAMKPSRKKPHNKESKMKAVAVTPGKPNSIHLRDVPKPKGADVPQGRGVLVKILRVGVVGTDKEINAAEYGAAPEGDNYLIIGHESLGRVEEVGPSVTEFKPGDFVALTVRRPGSSIYDQIGTHDMTTDDGYFERGINLRHGFLTEYVVDSPEYIVRVTGNLKEVGVLMEPMSVAQKAIEQAYRIQQRLRVWHPRRAAVLGSSTLGLLATLVLRLRGVEVTAFGNTMPPCLNSKLLEGIGARYISTKQTSLTDASAQFGPFDLILEGTGYSPLVFEAMNVLAKNGVLAMVSVTGGARSVEVPADHNIPKAFA